MKNFVDGLPILIRRRTQPDCAATESWTPTAPVGKSSQLTESRAGPLADAMERAGTTGGGLDMMAERWSKSITQLPKIVGKSYQNVDYG